MKKQNYSNHIRYYKPHHLYFYSLAAFSLSLCVYFLFTDSNNFALWFQNTLLAVLLIFLALLVRQHYGLTNQNRTVRLELRLRYYILTNKRFEEIESKLSRGQIHALRFAPDEELILLTERAVKENLSADEIKRSIINWLPDEMRV